MSFEAEAGTPIYDSARHEPLTTKVWSDGDAEAEIVAIAQDFESAGDPQKGWPTHPLDDPRGFPKWASYMGAAGAVSSLRILRQLGFPVRDHSAMLVGIRESYLARPDFGYETGLQQGEVGILAPAVLEDPDDPILRGDLLQRMRATFDHPAWEITSGVTGVLHVALTLFRATGDEEWGQVYRDGAAALFRQWEPRANTEEWFWVSDIFGSVRSYYGACHGIAGNAQALLLGRDLLPQEWFEPLAARVLSTLRAGMLEDESGINWPVSADASGRRRLVHWCHGASGVVAALGESLPSGLDPSGALERMLLAAGEFVWRAGPLKKGGGVCHGTGGNGYALLALYRRTGHELWLDRARRFAMHAIEQCRAHRSEYVQGRYTLWTGDGGLAIYLQHCRTPEQTAFPGLQLL